MRMYRDGMRQRDIAAAEGIATSLVSRIINTDPTHLAERKAALDAQTALVERVIDMRDRGLTHAQMATELGIDKHRISYLLKSSAGGRQIIDRSAAASKARRDAVVELSKRGVGTTEIAGHLGISTGRVSHILRDAALRGTFVDNTEARRVFDSSLTMIEALHALGQVPVPLELHPAEIERMHMIVERTQRALKNFTKRVRIAYNIPTKESLRKTGDDNHGE